MNSCSASGCRLLGREREVETIRQAMSPDYDRGTWRPSPNFDTRSGGTPFFVIIHTCEGAYSGCWSWLTNSASAGQRALRGEQRRK